MKTEPRSTTVAESLIDCLAESTARLPESHRVKANFLSALDRAVKKRVKFDAVGPGNPRQLFLTSYREFLERVENLGLKM